MTTAQDFQSNQPEQPIIPNKNFSTYQDNSHTSHFTLTDKNHRQKLYRDELILGSQKCCTVLLIMTLHIQLMKLLFSHIFLIN